jgi:hypothetical protein
MPAAIPAIVSVVVSTVVSYGISYIATSLFGGSQKPKTPSFGTVGDSSPRYGFGPLQNTVSSEIPLPTIYGEVKYAGNYLWQDPPEGGEEVARALGVCVGEIDRIYDLRFNDLMVGTKGQWIAVDLGATGRKAITEVKINQGSQGFADFVIQASHDGVSWKDLHSATGNSSGLQTFSFSNTLAFRYWRILSVGAGLDAGVLSVSEIELRVTSGGANEAAGKTAFANFEDTDHEAGKVIDGNTGTSWQATKVVHANNTYTDYPGLQTDPIDSRCTGKVDYAWRGTAKVLMTQRADEKLRGDVTVTMIVRGKKVKTWDTGTQSFSGAKAWSDNPAEIIRDILTDSFNGIGVLENEIDDASFGAVAEYCNALVSDNQGGVQKRYVLNYALDARRPATDIINELTPTFGGFLIQSQGKYVLKVRKPEGSVMNFDDGQNGSLHNILKGSFAYSKHSKDDNPNRIKFQYIDPDQNYTKVYALAEDKIAQDERAAYEGGDGIVTREVEFLAVTRFTQASRLATILLKETAYTPLTCVFRTNIKALPLDAGDIVNVSHALPNWTNKPFRVLEIKQFPNQEFEIQATEYNPSIYNDDYGSAVTFYDYGSPDNPLAPPPAPSNVLIVEGGGVNSSSDWIGWLDVSWTPPANTQFISHYLIEYKRNAEGWIAAGTTSGATFRVNSIVPENSVYTVRVKSVSTFDRISDPAESSPLTTLGKLAPPSDVAGFAVSFAGDHLRFAWNEIPDPDAYGYELREGASWNTAVVIATNITGLAYDLFSLTAGTKNYLIKAIDTSGIYSLNASNAGIVITNVPQQNIVLTLEDLFNGIVSGDAELIYTNDYNPAYNRQTVSVKTDGGWDDGGNWDDGSTWDGAYVTTPGYYTSPVIDLGRSFNANLVLDLGVYNESSGSLAVEIAYSDADPNPSTFVNFTTGQYSFRYAKFRFTLQTSDPLKPIRLFKARYNIDVPDVEQSALNVSINAGGTSVPLNGFFKLESLIITNVGSTAKMPTVTSQDAAQFTVKLWNPQSASFEAGNINYNAKGY